MSGRANTSGLIHFLLGLASSRASGQVVGLIAVLTIVWFAGHLAGLDTTDKKLIAMLAVFAAFVIYLIARWFWTKRSGDKLVEELATHNAGSQAEIDEIQGKMTDVLKSLKASHLGAGHRGNAALYALPWYMIIGPSATGKSTLFANSGLHFPYANANELHIQGFGGTRNCDWWFSDQAVLIDTAGRYTTESADNKEWLSFLGLLKKHRPKLPVNGVIVAISVSDILTSDSEGVRHHVNLVRERIQELITELGVVFPVHISFTKTDLISGFEPFFADLSEKEREQVWGAYLLDESEDQSQDPAELFELRMEELYQRLCEQRLSKLARERNVHRKALIFDFPNQFKSASIKLTEFVNLLFKDNPYQEVPWFAGVYFTSGTQEGTPVERILSGVREQFCSVAIEQTQETITKSYFINRFFNDVVFKLQDLTRGNRRERKIQRWLKAVSVSATLASVAATVALLTTSYTMNSLLVSAGEQKIEVLVDKAVSGVEPAEHVAAFMDVFEHYTLLQSYEQKLPWRFILGIYEGDETLDSVASITQQEMTTLISMPIQNHVKQELTSFSEKWALAPDMDSKNVLRQEYYRLLKLQLMFSENPEQMDLEFAAQEIGKHWRSLLGLNFESEELEAFNSKLDNIVTMYIGLFGKSVDEPGELAFWESDEDLVATARLQLDTQPEPEPLYQQIIASKAAKKKPLTLRNLLEPKNRKLLNSNYRVPYAYTKAGWEDYVYPEMQRIVTIVSSGDWVMGTANEAGENLVDKSKAQVLEKAIRALYFKDYAEHWFALLGDAQVKQFTGLADASISLAKLSALDGPLTQLMTNVNKNINLTDKPVAKQQKVTSDAEKLAEKINVEMPTVVVTKVPELGNRFSDLRRYTQSSEPGKASDFLQQYIRTLSTVHSDIKGLIGSNEPEAQAMEFAQQLLSGEDVDSGLQASWIVVESQLRALEPVTKKAIENLFKSALRSSFDSIAVVSRRQLDEEWQELVYSLYETGIKGKFPFYTKGPDAAVADVAELLNSRSGVLWKFVDDELTPFLKKRKGNWEERTWNGMGVGFDKQLLTGLKRANRVTRSLFSKDSETSGFQFQALPVPQRGVRETYLGFSEQSYRYRNEPEEWRKFSWPGKGTTEVARVYAVDRTGRRVSVEKSGPWALLRVLNEAQIKWIKGTEYAVNWAFNEQNKSTEQKLTAKFMLKSGRSNGIFSKSTMTSFSLPNSLFSKAQITADLAKLN
ncbi:type VI secretion system membrane subunit TssM [Thalassotalea euphylliae]|uniref:Type VI secretion system membrane subunit TssM n=1 Tax=Thalassotalea euphylliae TaxID=1655234 RepID=A0A3E0TQ13_9GAMM|nr:type VI secretion system membrane subunit TssM [Thalassotalea euphylliae]REL26629.1 type VI secretion system membrane subunit TssM [Thalassotalea euphylliae]